MKILTLMTFIFLSFSSVSFAELGESQKAECVDILQDSRSSSAQAEGVDSQDEDQDSSSR